MRETLYLHLVDLQDAALWWLHRIGRQLRSLWLCHGRHSDELVLTASGIFLSCVRCRRRTAGWDVRVG